MVPTDEEREDRESVDLKDRGLAAFLAWLIPGLGHLYQGRTAKAGLFFVCIMGTFLYGLYLGSGDELLMFNTSLQFQDELDRGVIPQDLRLDFERHKVAGQANVRSLSQNASVSTEEEGSRWRITDGSVVYTVRKEGNRLSILGKLGWARVVYFSWRRGDKRLAYLCQVGIGLPALPALMQASRMGSGKRVWLNGFMAPPWIPSSGAAWNHPDRNRNQPSDDELNYHLAPFLELGKHFTMIAGLLNILAIYDAWAGPVFSETARKKEDEDEEDQDDDPPSEVPS